jgi:hypothetical protein
MPASETIQIKHGQRISEVIRQLEAIKKQEGDLYVCQSSDPEGNSHHHVGEVSIMDGVNGGVYATLWPSDREIDG